MRRSHNQKLLTQHFPKGINNKADFNFRIKRVEQRRYTRIAINDLFFSTRSVWLKRP